MQKQKHAESFVKEYTELANSNRLWIIEYSSSRWAGAPSHVVVVADSSTEAEIKADDHMETEMRELYYDEDQDLDPCDTDDCSYTVNSVEPLKVGSEYWEFFMNPTQQINFYPIVD